MAEGSSFSPRIDLIFSSSLFPLCKIVLNFKKKNRSIFPHAKFSSILKIYFEIWLYVKPMAEGSSVSPRIDLIFSSIFPICKIVLNFKKKNVAFSHMRNFPQFGNIFRDLAKCETDGRRFFLLTSHRPHLL